MLPIEMESIVIPAKGIRNSKSRLATLLQPEDVWLLVQTMLDAVLDATSGWEARFVVTDDEEAASIALEAGCKVVREKGTGLNDAVSVGLREAIAAGSSVALVLPSDLPLIEEGDVTELFAAETQVAIVQAEDGGTNALRLRPPTAITPQFGTGSAKRHLESAQAAGLSCQTLSIPRLALDIDDMNDLARLAKDGGDTNSALIARRLLADQARI